MLIPRRYHARNARMAFQGLAGGAAPKKAGVVENEGQFRADVNQGRDDWGEVTEEGQDDARGVHGNGAPEVEHDHTVAASANGQRLKNAREVAGHEGYAGGFQRGVCALAHGDADGGLGQGGGIVDAVADHGDLAALREQLADFRLLLMWQQIADGFINAEPSADGGGGIGSVAREQNRAIALPF